LIFINYFPKTILNEMCIPLVFFCPFHQQQKFLPGRRQDGKILLHTSFIGFVCWYNYLDQLHQSQVPFRTSLSASPSPRQILSAQRTLSKRSALKPG
jgi:hypothetical protein